MNHPRLVFLCFLVIFAVFACDGSDGRNGADGQDAPQPLGQDDDLPGVVVAITAVTGATGPGNSFQSGDRITVDFTIKSKAGEPQALTELSRGSIMVSGPTFNYQRVIAAQRDLLTASADLGGGAYRYTFPVPIPDNYLAPLNYTGLFPAGVLANEKLLAGSYTVGIEARKDFDVGESTLRDVGNTTADFLFGGASTLAARAVVANANCTSCHVRFQAHGANRNNVTNCLLCHTAGSEPRPSSAVSQNMDFKVMIHKIHAGASLPSVNGVSTKSDGTRDYAAAKVPYEVGGTDYSKVVFPVWPSLYRGMPRDTGYSALSAGEKALEDAMLAGPVACAKCHEDPDGDGPELAPLQGDLAYKQPTRAACGSCHDDWVWDRPYRANTQSMPAQPNDATCTLCHRESGTALDVRDAHRHPLLNKALAPGLHIDLTGVTEAGTHDNDGTIDPGEGVALTFTIRDETGADVSPAGLSSIEAVINGPTGNPNLLYANPVPTAALVQLGGPTYTMPLPELVHYEFLGDSSGGSNEVFTSARAPHWNVAGAATTVYRRTASGAATTLSAAAQPTHNYVDVASAAGFSRDDLVVISDGAAEEEYFKIQFVEGNRLWLGSRYSQSSYKPALDRTHAVGSPVQVVTLTAATVGTDYTLDVSTGQITEVGNQLGGGAIVVTYTTSFRAPATYPGTFNESPGMDTSAGKWTGLAVVDGTYSVGLMARRTFSFSPFGEATSYSEGSTGGNANFLFGSAATLTANTRIDSAAACYKCHEDVQFHGGNRRGYATCLVCHGVAGAEDRPQYVAANAPPTTGVSVDFRTMLHKIHQGRDLAKGSSYEVVGFGLGYPNNFSIHRYDDVGYPALPSGTKDCASCHGAANTAWQSPASRIHPQGQAIGSRVWRDSCNSCHDSDAATAHIAVNTDSFGREACAVCHGPGDELRVERVHKVR